MSLMTRGLVQLLRRSTVAINANTTILTAARHRRFSAEIGSKQGSGDVVNSGAKPVVVTETKPADGKGKDDTVKLEICGDVEDEEEEMEEMLQDGPAGKEWGGPTRGGLLREPTRFGDWERKGRCSDF